MFKLSAPYCQKHYGVSKRIEKTIMDMTRATILKGNINDNLWPEVVLVMIYIKNS